MRTLTQQFDDTLAVIYSADRDQRKILSGLLVEYQKNEELVDYVMEQMGDRFKMGDDAKAFFSRCADELFLKRLEANSGKKRETDFVRRYHPLFGAAWWTK